MRFPLGTHINPVGDVTNPLQRLANSIPASYTVWADTSVTPTMYYAESNHPSYADANSTDAATAIQTALTNCLNGGKVFIRRGHYPLSAGLTVGARTTLQGEGVTHQLDANLQECTYLKLDANVDEDIITNSDHVNGNYGICIRDIFLDGNKANQASGHGIHFVGTGAGYCKSYLIDNVVVSNVKENCLTFDYAGVGQVLNSRFITAGGYAFYTTNSADWLFMGNDLGAVTYDGIYVSGGGGRIIGNKIYVARYGINTASTCMIVGNWINDITQTSIVLSAVLKCTISNNFLYKFGSALNNTYYGINIGNSSNCTVTGNMIDGDNEGKYGVYINAGANNVVTGNTITNVVTAGVYPAANNIIDDNVGYVSKNSGYSTGTGAQQTIAHGCAFTPTASQVFLSERSTGGALAYQSAAPDVTNIYVTATGAKDYNWRVER